MTLNWDKIWGDFDKWLESAEEEDKCLECGHRDYTAADWSEQQKQIEKLVERAIKRKKP